MIPQETVAKILDTVRVEEVIGDFVSLRRQGANYLACCPFHNEKTPSFSVSPAKGFYYCFGCHKGGSSVNFLMEHENMSYVEALRYLARKYHIEVVEEEEDAETIAARQRSESLYLVSEFAQKYFADQLKSGEGRALGYNYFRSRGMEEATIEKFGLGWSPSDRSGLLKAAREAGYKEEYLVATGLCIQTQDGRLYDRFHDRAIFPIYSDSGRVVAFGGRTLFSDYKERNIGKYINSPESEIYVKSKTLYGLFQAKSAIAKADKCILVEGNIDVISMHQLGITNTVASCGTALTVDHIRRIKRFTNNVTIIYDGDSAGIHAALRGVGMVLQEGMDVKVVVLPDGKDPDDFCKEHTLEEAQAFLAAHERDFINFKIDVLLEDVGDDPLKMAGVISDIADTIALIPDAVKRAVYIDACSKRLSFDRESIKQRVELTVANIKEEQWKRKKALEKLEKPQAPAPQPGETKTVEVASPLQPAEKSIMEFILNNGLDAMKFPTGHKFYMDPPVTVADFIDGSLSEDNTVLTVPAYASTYDEYFVLYDEGLSQEEILRRLVMSETPGVAACVAELTSRQHEVTERSLKDSMTNEATIVLQGVPKSLLLYQDKLLEQKEIRCREQMKEPGADVMALLVTVRNLSVKRKALQKELYKI